MRRWPALRGCTNGIVSFGGNVVHNVYTIRASINLLFFDNKVALYISNLIALFGLGGGLNTIGHQKYYWFVGGSHTMRRHNCSKLQGAQVDNRMHSTFSLSVACLSHEWTMWLIANTTSLKNGGFSQIIALHHPEYDFQLSSLWIGNDWPTSDWNFCRSVAAL